ncbi:MAG: efflux RND transporter permease subunit [Longimicrobiaceae bacterium]
MRIVDLSIRRPVAVAMAFLAVVVFGVVSFSRLPLDLLPDVSFPTLTVQTQYPGVGPQEIENLVSRPIEEAVSVVQGVRQVTSRSRPGRSDVTLTFRWGTDMDFAGLDVRERLDLLNLPPAATRPTIARYDPNAEPVLRFALTPARPLDPNIPADRRELVALRHLAEEQVRRGLEGVEGVAGVRVTGGLVEEIHVEVDQARLAGLGIPFQQVVGRLEAENINLAGGILEEAGAEYVVRTVNEFVELDEIQNVIVGTANGQPVLLRDVGTVRRDAAERETISRVGGAEAVEVAILRESTANIVRVAETVRERVRLLEETLPQGIRVTLVRDESIFIRRAVEDVQQAAIVGGLLAVLVLLLFLRHIPTTLIIATAIPISVIATFVLMFGRGITLNIMSLGGLALGVGMLVDSAIVVLESIARERERGLTPIEGAQVGTSHVARAVIASTLTTVAVFLPIVFVEGIAGQLFGDQAWTVSFALVSALVVALTLIPMLAARGSGVTAMPAYLSEHRRSARFGRVVAGGAGHGMRAVGALGRGVGRVLSPLTNGFDRGYRWIDRRYPIWLRSSLRRPWRVLGVAGLVVILSLLLFPRLGIELIPEFRQGELIVELEAAPGTSLTRMEELVRQTEGVALGIEGVREVFSTVGMRGVSGAMGGGGDIERHAATVLVRLEGLQVDEDRVADWLSDGLAILPGVAYRVERPSLFTMAAPIEVEVRGYNLAMLNQIASDVRARLRAMPDVGAVDEERRQGNPEVTIRFDRERVARAGLTVADAAEAIRSRVQGASATDFTERERDLGILVRAQEEQRQSLRTLGDLRIETANGSVALGAIATLGFGEGPAEIVRRNGSRVALVEAQPAGRDLAGAISRIEQEVRSVPAPADVAIVVAGQSQELRDSIRSMQFALLLAIFLVYLVMASQFESLRQPFVILVSIPLAAVGAILSLWITGTPVSVVALIGIVMLAGIVVNNAIVLIDTVNQLRRDEGLTLDAALIRGGRLRLRPIVMSTLTTVLGLLPLALIRGEGMELRAPLAIPVIGGLLVATLLTLLVVPVLYRFTEERGMRKEVRGTATAERHLDESGRQSAFEPVPAD